MEQHCTLVGHQGQLIFAICMSEKCSAVKRTLCVVCLQGIHVGCMNQFLYTQQFLDKLMEIKAKTQSQEEHKIIKLVAILTQISYRFIELLLVFGNNMIINYDKANQITRIDKILAKQNMLSNHDWNEGYKILTNQLAIEPQSTQPLIEQLNLIRQSIQMIVYNSEQKNQIHLKQDIQPIQQLVKSDWNNITPQKPLIIQAKHKIYTIALSPDGKYVASAGDSDYSIRIWNPITGKVVGNDMKGHTNMIYSINYSKCGKYIVSGSDDKTIRRWNVQTQQQIYLPMNGHESNVREVQYTPDQRYIVSCSWDKTIRLWSPETGKEHIDKRIQNGNSILCMSLSPISNDVAIGDDKGMIKIYDYERHQLSGQSLNGHNQHIMSLQYSVDGQYIVSGGKHNAILLWNAVSRQQIASLLGHQDNYGSNVFSVSFSPDTRYIISGGVDFTVRIWDRVNSKQHGEPLTYHQDCVWSTQFSLDGKYIITGGDDKQLRIMIAPIGQ